ncbi:hypothetical protein GGTG_02073 [Gaeumannomyces tritici R3-111a-1]|uniref:Uncharacterized protein n=1 Tax=Gaeumannomyces tritici (strain R3-111a-1) TaxID=644352 RepID=J3NLC5_GAET3|nr:hypothetical protein GGTG_02073 [Gaeumannomyces tritici R3-111a-1]EJT82099.1 hypothetical protein GGTG_02073 [Gaeumannomyces tritici R3-111a-1]
MGAFPPLSPTQKRVSDHTHAFSSTKEQQRIPQTPRQRTDQHKQPQHKPLADVTSLIRPSRRCHKPQPNKPITNTKMSSPPSSPSHIHQAAERAPVLKIVQTHNFVYDSSTVASSPPRAVSAPVRSFSFSQGSHCHCCGGIFVISNRCSNRQCEHVQCAQCY